MLMNPTRRRRTDTSRGDVFRSAFQALAWAAFVVLVAFHAWLLWTHATVGKLLEPDVAVRWGLAGLLGLAFWSLRRCGLPLFRGRRAVVLWMLVVLIHCHAVWTGDAAEVHFALPQNVGDLAPAGVQVVAALTALLLLARLVVHFGASHPRLRETVRPGRLTGLPAGVCTLPFSPRPPPVR